MSYRDDRDALREQASALERELDVTRAELERLRSGELVQAPSAPQSPPLGLWLITILSLVAVAQVLPVPVPVRLGVAVLAVTLIVPVLVLGSTVVIARPSEAVVLSGRERQSGGGSRGYRLVRGGRAVRVPLLESSARLDLGAFRVPISLRRVRTQGAAIDAELVVHARVIPEEPGIDQAVKRMLGVGPEQRGELCRTLLDPVLSDAIGQFESDELQRDDWRFFADKLSGFAGGWLAESGIEVLAVHVLDWREASA